MRLTLNRTRSSSGSCSVAAAAAFTAVRGLAACLAGPVASAAAPATQASTLIILSIAKLRRPAHSRVSYDYKLGLTAAWVGFQIAELQNNSPGGLTGLVRTVYEVGGLLQALCSIRL